jgi:hypothetical protein
MPAWSRPVAEGQVRGDPDRALLLAGGDELEEEVRGVAIEGIKATTSITMSL